MFSLEKRPFSFDEMVGNKGTLAEMRNRSLTKNFPQVMFFAGESGSGKSTLAFIIGALINCKNPIKTEGQLSPCGECPYCKSIKDERYRGDFHYFDCSSMSKDDVTKINQIVASSPMFDENKIIILDEAQELSKTGKGATLKLLEKKRKNVYFILCTMAPEKIDKAILDRGQVYKFRELDREDIVEYLAEILRGEGLFETIEESFITEGIFTIAENSHGSARAAASYLERCIVGKFYTSAQILEEFGFVSEQTTFDIVLKLLKKDFSGLNELAKIDMKEFFFITRKALTSALIYQGSKIAPVGWQAARVKKFGEYDSLRSLLKVYEKMGMDTYFQNPVFLYRLADYMMDASSPKVIEARPGARRKVVTRKQVV